MGKERRKTGRPLRLTDLWSGATPKQPRPPLLTVAASTEAGTSSRSLDKDSALSPRCDDNNFSSQTTGSFDRRDGVEQVSLLPPVIVSVINTSIKGLSSDGTHLQNSQRFVPPRKRKHSPDIPSSELPPTSSTLTPCEPVLTDSYDSPPTALRPDLINITLPFTCNSVIDTSTNKRHCITWPTLDHVSPHTTKMATLLTLCPGGFPESRATQVEDLYPTSSLPSPPWLDPPIPNDPAPPSPAWVTSLPTTSGASDCVRTRLPRACKKENPVPPPLSSGLYPYLPNMHAGHTPRSEHL